MDTYTQRIMYYDETLKQFVVVSLESDQDMSFLQEEDNGSPELTDNSALNTSV